MAYPVDFFFSLVAFFSFQFIGPLMIFSIYSSGGFFAGWTFHEALLLQGILLTIKGFCSAVFFGILWKTVELVRKGTLELILLRPVQSLRLLVMEAFDDEDIAQFSGGILVLIIALSHLTFSIPQLFFMLISMFFGILFLFALAMLCSAASIKWVNTFRLYEFLDILFSFASYPKSIYSRGVGILFSTVLPLFLLAFFPASILLGLTLKGLPYALIGVLLLNILSYNIWSYTLRHYTGAGG